MIRNATIKDAKELFILESSLFTKDEFQISLSSFYYHLKQNTIFVYETHNKIVGYILVLSRKNYDRIYSICISADFQGKSIGSKLLEYLLLNQQKRLQLEVKVTNTKAIKLYEKYGFIVKKTLKDYYPLYVDGFLMVKDATQ